MLSCSQPRLIQRTNTYTGSKVILTSVHRFINVHLSVKVLGQEEGEDQELGL